MQKAGHSGIHKKGACKAPHLERLKMASLRSPLSSQIILTFWCFLSSLSSGPATDEVSIKCGFFEDTEMSSDVATESVSRNAYSFYK